MNLQKQNEGALAELMKTDPNLFSSLRPGDLVEGKVLEKSAKRLLLDLGKAGTGIVYRSEMQNAREALREVEVGSLMHAKVINIDNEEGLVELSLTEADKQKAWTEVAELRDKEEVVKIKPVKFNRGGLIADLMGLQAFLPTSQLSNEHYPKASSDDRGEIGAAIEKLVGVELEVRVIDVNPRTNKLIVSERAAQELSSKELAKNYTVGQVVEGIVSGVADFGAFLRFTDNPAVEGLIHISELDWVQIENPKEVIHVDDVVKAKIIEIKDGKISLSLKALKPDPWEASLKHFEAGKEVQGRVYAFNPFGAVVNLAHGIQGQIHVTEFGGVEEMKKAISLGKEYTFFIEAIKPEERRIALKLKK